MSNLISGLKRKLRVYANEKYVLKGNTTANKDKYVDYDVFFKFSQKQELNFEIGSTTISVGLGNEAYADSYSPPVGFYIYWWGWQLSLDEWTTQNIIKACNTGAAASAIASVLAAAGIFSSAAAVPAALISGILWFGSAAIDWIDYNGGNKGVYFRGYWTVPPTYYLWYRS